MNKPNYNRLFEETLQSSPKGSSLLLHACCAPCSTYCLYRTVEHFDVTLYYSNDNITNKEEWEKRLAELKKLIQIINCGKFEKQPLFPVKLAVKPLDSSAYFDCVIGYEGEREGGTRCDLCYEMRLSDTASLAKANGFDYFGTTLTVSPYKNSFKLNQIGNTLESTVGVKFLQSDFKKLGGYSESIRLSEKYGLYRQHYCGCPFSLPRQNDKIIISE
ncbi:MAG: epoxyqueuosine reductase QueH [Corallococcus sp.]|nr:epoxyqueuosine reductase QueH [Corallococcus sp.]